MRLPVAACVAVAALASACASGGLPYEVQAYNFCAGTWNGERTALGGATYKQLVRRNIDGKSSTHYALVAGWGADYHGCKVGVGPTPAAALNHALRQCGGDADYHACRVFAVDENASAWANATERRIRDGAYDDE